MISIVIPLYNKETQIRNTLESVFHQTFQNFEVVVVDDGSTDGSVEVVRAFADNRIRLIHQANQGVSAARNRGIQEAKYEHIALLDADDEWKPEYLQSQIHLIEKYPECGVFACAYEFYYNDNQSKNIILNKISFEGEDGLLTNYFEVASCSHPPLWTSAIVARKGAFIFVGGFPIGVIAGEDLLTWARLAVNYSIAYNLKASSIFFIDDRHNLRKEPTRIPAKDDVVGRGLEKLYYMNRDLVGLREYVALWYKMRSAVYLRLGNTGSALAEIIKSIKFNPKSLPVWIYLGLCFCPVTLRRYIFEKFSR